MLHASHQELFRYLRITVGLRWKLTDFILFSEPALTPAICSHMMMPFSLIAIYSTFRRNLLMLVRARKKTICFIAMFDVETVVTLNFFSISL